MRKCLRYAFYPIVAAILVVSGIGAYRVGYQDGYHDGVINTIEAVNKAQPNFQIVPNDAPPPAPRAPEHVPPHVNNPSDYYHSPLHGTSNSDGTYQIVW